MLFYELLWVRVAEGGLFINFEEWRKFAIFVAYMQNGRFTLEINMTAATEVNELIGNAEKIVITCHVSPDGDALGSSLGLWHTLRAMGKDVTVVTPDCAPKLLLFLPGIKNIVVATRQADYARNLIAGADLIFCLDFNDTKRVDKLQDALDSSTARKIMIDHHLDPVLAADVVISHPEVSSTSALLYMLLWQLRLTRYVRRAAAECIYTGMMTDTGNFSYNSNDPDLYIIISDLLKKGIDKDKIYTQVFNTCSESRLRICGYGQYKMILFPNHKAALITLSEDELKEFGYAKGDTESLVNVPLSIPEVNYSVFMREDSPEYVKISTRSKGDFPVNLMCEKYFGGGGHLNAAGGEFHGTLSDAVSRLLSIMPEFDVYNHN